MRRSLETRRPTRWWRATARSCERHTSAVTIRARIAPSPTGPLHIGTARTALFNYLFARRQAARSCCASRTPTWRAPRSTTSGTSSMGSTGSGIEWDEGPEVAGLPARGPTARTARSERLRARTAEAAERLLGRGQGLRVLLHAGGAGRRPRGPGGAATNRRSYVGRCAAPDARRARRSDVPRAADPRSASGSAKASSSSTTSSAATCASTPSPRRRPGHRPLGRHAAVPLHGRRRRRGDGHQPRHPGRGPPLQHAQAHPAVPGAGRRRRRSSRTCRSSSTPTGPR